MQTSHGLALKDFIITLNNAVTARFIDMPQRDAVMVAFANVAAKAAHDNPLRAFRLNDVANHPIVVQANGAGAHIIPMYPQEVKPICAAHTYMRGDMTAAEFLLVEPLGINPADGAALFNQHILKWQRAAAFNPAKDFNTLRISLSFEQLERKVKDKKEIHPAMPPRLHHTIYAGALEKMTGAKLPFIP